MPVRRVLHTTLSMERRTRCREVVSVSYPTLQFFKEDAGEGERGNDLFASSGIGCFPQCTRGHHGSLRILLSRKLTTPPAYFILILTDVADRFPHKLTESDVVSPRLTTSLSLSKLSCQHLSSFPSQTPRIRTQNM